MREAAAGAGPVPASGSPPTRRLVWAAFALGFALGGFFDGILLHQILQWHHLLSGLQGGIFQDLRVQVLADGIFHALMYVIAVLGLWLLWRSRAAIGHRGAGRVIAGWGLLGFGIWHVVDAVLSHWVLGIHRIRQDVDNPLFWDLSWFVVLGLAVIAAGWWLLRNDTPSGSPGGAAASVLALGVLVAGPVAALPPPGGAPSVVLFRPGTTAPEVLAALDAVDGRMVWHDATGDLWAIEIGAGHRPVELYRHGALMVGSGFLAAGCLARLRP
jgi:uncharacterized membrane protein